LPSRCAGPARSGPGRAGLPEGGTIARRPVGPALREKVEKNLRAFRSVCDVKYRKGEQVGGLAVVFKPDLKKIMCGAPLSVGP
jgi:hypothetical protein